MVKLKFALLILLSSVAWGDVTSIVTFPGGTNGSVQTNKNGRFNGDSYLTYSTATKVLSSPGVSLSTLTANGVSYTFPASQSGGLFLRTDGAGGLTWATPATAVSGAAPAFAVNDGGVQISSPTNTIKFDASPFVVSLQDTTTAFVQLNSAVVTLLGPSIDLASEVTGSLPAASIASGSLGTNVIASSVAVGKVTDSAIVSVSGSKVSGDIPGNAAGITGSVNVSQVIGAVTVYPASATAMFPYGFSVSTITGTAFNATASSASVMGAGGLRVLYGATVSTLTVTGSTISIAGVTYYLPNNGGTAGQVLSTTGGTTISTLTWAAGSGGVSVYPATATASFPFGFTVSTITANAFNATQTSMTVTGVGGLRSVYGITAATATFTGAGAGEIILTISGSTYTVIATSAIPAVGHFAVFSSTWGTLADGGTSAGGGGGTPGGSAYQVQYASANGTQFAGSANLTNTGSTISVVGIYTVTETNVSSKTFADVYFDISGSTLNAGVTKLNGATGNSGQVFTSGGASAYPTWTTPSGISVYPATATASFPFGLSASTLPAANLVGVIPQGATSYIQNIAVLQTGAQFSVSSATVGNGGLTINGSLEINRPDLTGFSGGRRMHFDSEVPFLGEGGLVLYNTNFTGSSNEIRFRDELDLTYGVIDMGKGTSPIFSISRSTCTLYSASSCRPKTRWTANSSGSQILNDYLGNAVFTVDRGSVSMASFNATQASMTVTGIDGLRSSYQLAAGSFTGAGLSTCGDSTHAIGWSSTDNLFTCQTISAAGGGSGSPVAITTGPLTTFANPAISSPMLVGVYDQSQFGILATGTTAFITIAYSTNSVSATYTAVATDTIVLADATGGSFTVTLSTINANGSSIKIGKVYTVSRTNSGANTVTVAGATGNILGDATQVLTAQWATIDVFWEGMNWGIK